MFGRRKLENNLCGCKQMVGQWCLERYKNMNGNVCDRKVNYAIFEFRFQTG
jgi:hypothetical protein